MTHEEMSKKTRSEFASALKELMTEKPLNKITVKDLTERCNVNRKTFYYHFTDIYDLLKWILEEEAIDVVKKFDMITDFQDAALFILDYIEENQHILNCAYDAMGREELKRFLYKDFIQIVQTSVEELISDLDLHPSDDYMNLICNFYSEAITSVMIDWLRKPDRMEKEKAVAYLDTILFSSIPAALKAGEEMRDQ